MNKDINTLRTAIEKWKYPVLILLVGLLLMLIPTSKEQKVPANNAEEALAAVLASTQSVGEAQVLISDHGVVVACAGAANASVRLDIIRAVGSYTGFGSDKITILKLKNGAGRRNLP